MTVKKGEKAKVEGPPPDSDDDLDFETQSVDGNDDLVMWKKSDVEKLRNEAAGRRAQLRQYTNAFSNYTDAEVQWFLERAQQLITNPTQAIAGFKELITLYDPDGRVEPDESHPKREGDKSQNGKDDAMANKGANNTDGEKIYLTKTELNDLLEKNKAEVLQASLSREMRREAQAMGYTDDHPGLALFLDLAKQNNGDLKEADKLYRERVTAEAERLAAAKQEDNDSFPRRGRGAGPVLPQTEVPKTLEEARAAAEALFAANPGN